MVHLTLLSAEGPCSCGKCGNITDCQAAVYLVMSRVQLGPRLNKTGGRRRMGGERGGYI